MLVWISLSALGDKKNGSYCIPEEKGLSRGQEVISCGGLVISSARSLIVNPSSLLIASLIHALMFRRSWSLWSLDDVAL